ncbi:AAA family ATPase [archaeon]|nr:MAG: AAA family ATPase [archaeon]
MNWLPELTKGTAILITGTPGTGKTTISRLLATELRACYVDPKTLLRRKEVDYTYDEKRKTRTVSLKRLRNRLCERAARTDHGLVIDSHIALETGPLPRLVRAIVLRCDPIVLEQRLERKRWSKSKIGENLQAEILAICLWDAVENYGWNKILEIDTTEKAPSRVIQLIMKDLHKKRIQRQPKVDWLLSLKRKGILARYLE